MEALAPFISAALGALKSALPAPPAPAAPAPAVAAPTIPQASVASLGLKILLEPSAGGVLFRAASNTVATIYPVYASFKAIESKDKADDVQWLTYWTIIGSLTLAEYVADQALSKVPYYYHAKFAALLWLQLPQTQGATYLYERFYKPTLIRYQPKIDAVLSKGQKALVYLYNTYKLPIDAAVALATELKRQLAAAVAALTAEGGSKGDEAAMPKAG